MSTTTIVEGAVILNVSTEYMVRLLDEGKIPFCLKMEDVLAYKAERDRSRNKGLEDLTRLTQEMGLYEHTCSHGHDHSNT